MDFQLDPSLLHEPFAGTVLINGHGGAGSWEIYTSIEKLFDRDPPQSADFSDFIGAMHTSETLFDVLGRRYTLGANLRF